MIREGGVDNYIRYVEELITREGDRKKKRTSTVQKSKKRIKGELKGTRSRSPALKP